MDNFGLDKDGRNTAARAKREKEKAIAVRLEPPFPYAAIPPDLDFMGFPANPEKKAVGG